MPNESLDHFSCIIDLVKCDKTQKFLNLNFINIECIIKIGVDININLVIHAA